MLDIRTNVLLDEDRYKRLTEITRRNKTSLGAFIRQAIDEMLKQESEKEILTQKREAYNAIMELRKKMKPLKGIILRELIDYGRYR